eukprot:332474-Pyramimonas_sp.AAC.1
MLQHVKFGPKVKRHAHVFVGGQALAPRVVEPDHALEKHIHEFFTTLRVHFYTIGRFIAIAQGLKKAHDKFTI